MSALKRWMFLLRLVSPALATSAPGLGPWLARRRWPQTQGSLSLQGLREPVEVLRDTWGVPHLYAKNEHDLFFAQGYVHGQDRLFQLEMGRRLGDGTMAEVLDRPATGVDFFMRALGLRRMAEKSLAALGPDERTILESYADGINARMKREPLPIEFSILGVTPKPWTPLDTLVRGNIWSFLLGGNHRLELLRARLVAEVGEEVAALLLPTHAPESPLIVPPEARHLQAIKGARAFDGLDAVDDVLGDPNIVSGSNNWVVHGSRTASGKPLLANDVHIGLGLPSTWYENGLHGGRFDSVGFSLPGVPMLIIGHNGRIAWGMSNLGPDTQDFYIEKLDDPKKPTKYEYQGQWHDLEVREEKVHLRSGGALKARIRGTRHGPILSDVFSRTPDSPDDVLSLRWAQAESRPLFGAVLGINLAKNWEEFRAAAVKWESPGQNFVYADTDGNIGYQSTGLIPIRAPGHQGTVPVEGWTGASEWKGWIPFHELPASFNPPAGFAVTANNKITSDDYPYLIALNWFPGYRAKRITDLLDASRKHTVEDMARIQAETYSLPAESIRPYLLAVKPADDAQAKAVEALKAWDLRYETDRIGATVFQAWYIHVLRALLRHKLGPKLVERYLDGDYERHGSMHMPLVISLLGKPEDPWWDDPKTPERETRDDILRNALGAAVKWLGEQFGADPKGWAWGKVHTLTYQHAPLGRPMLPASVRRAFNSKTFAARGDNYSVDGASFTWSRPFKVVHGTALRMIVDLGDLSKSVSIHAPGQTEHLYHPHREDLVELSQKLEYHPMLHSRQAVEANTKATLRLEPATKLIG